MKTYTATERSEMHDGRSIAVRGTTIEEAAQHAIARLVSRTAEAHRCTGGHVCLEYSRHPAVAPGGGLTSIGPNIHIA
jgi:hypothetical protein